MTTIVPYLEKELKHYMTSYPWKMIVHEDVKSIYIHVYIPISENENYVMILHLDGWSDQVIQTPYKIVVPLLNQADTAEQGYLDAQLYGLRELAHTIQQQIKEINAGTRLKLDFTWPVKTIEQQIKTQVSLDRYPKELLRLEG